MLISESHKFLFIHARKTAGMSVRNVLLPYCLPTQQRYPMKMISKLHLDFNWRHHHFKGHASLKDAEKHIPNELFSQLYKFTIVRNPWDRLVSFYHFLLQRNGHWATTTKMNKISFKQFLDYSLKQHQQRPEYFSQYNIVLLKNGQMDVNKILRFENLNADWAELISELNIKGDLPVINKSKHRDYREFYKDVNDIDFVAKNWKNDIEAFNYSFE